jgi:hypothetical protein
VDRLGAGEMRVDEEPLGAGEMRTDEDRLGV